MTKLSHIPMQIQKWIASLAHLFFLILGLTGICLMYIHGNFGLGLTGIGSVPYEDTAEFNTQFNSDLNDIFLYMDYQDVFGADSSIDLSRRMLKMTFGPSETENFSLSSLISYLDSMGYQLDDDFNCQKLSEPKDGVKSREGYVEWSVQEPQRIYSYRSASQKRSTLEDATGRPVDVLAYPAGQYSTLAQVTLQSLGVHVTLSTNPGVNTVVKGLPQTLYAMLRFGITEDISPEALLDMIR